jgi:prepilin-type N-terminal cleavage/methylation domain-containing protein
VRVGAAGQKRQNLALRHPPSSIFHPRIRRARTRRPRRAFTLIEVLATLLLMGIVIPVAFRGVNVALAAASSARHQAEAATLAETKLNESVSQGDFNTGGQGDFGTDFPLYRWTLQTTQHDLDVTEVMVTVNWSERGDNRALNLSTFVFTGSASSTTTGGTAK